MRRREFLTLVGGAVAAWPMVRATAQQATPVVGFLTGSPNDDETRMDAFRQSLGAHGFVEGRDLAIIARSAIGRFEKLPELAGDLVRRGVNVIVARGSPAAVAAKSATSDIPIVFMTGGDPVRLGFVASLNRPARNMTGVTRLSHSLAPKQLELLHQVLPQSTSIAAIINPKNPNSETDLTELGDAANALRRKIGIFRASSERQIDEAVSELVRERYGAILLGNDGYFLDRMTQIVDSAARHRLPAIYTFWDFVEAGGLMSYASSSVEAMRLAGLYAARILKGERPSDMPVMQPTKFELVINLKTANALGIEIPPKFLFTADEVIE